MVWLVFSYLRFDGWSNGYTRIHTRKYERSSTFNVLDIIKAMTTLLFAILRRTCVRCTYNGMHLPAITTHKVCRSCGTSNTSAPPGNMIVGQASVTT